jgi:hypothetical protein
MEYEDFYIGAFVNKFSKDLKSGDSYSLSDIVIKPFIFHYLGPTTYNPVNFSPRKKFIFEREGKIITSHIIEHEQDVTIPSSTPFYVHKRLVRVKKPIYSRILLLEKRICQ